jgi:transcriptional regulator with XRE-family HTH domain
VITRRQLRAARALAGLSVRALAADAGVSHSAVHDIETGKTTRARGATLEALQRSLGGHGIEFGRDGWLRHREDCPDLTTADLEPLAVLALGRACRAAREARTWTSEDLAARIGISPEFYRRIEEAAVVPTISILIRLGAVLGMSLDALLGLSQPRPNCATLPQTAGTPALADPVAQRLQRSSAGVRRAVMMLLLELER